MFPHPPAQTPGPPTTLASNRWGSCSCRCAFSLIGPPPNYLHTDAIMKGAQRPSSSGASQADPTDVEMARGSLGEKGAP